MAFRSPVPQNPAPVWSLFAQLTDLPRPSKKEQRVVEWLENIARRNGCDVQSDDDHNVFDFACRPKGGFDHRPAIVIQNHIDMVCDAAPDKEIDFATDPITVFEKDGWVSADRTTLGADNGIGVCLALALIEAEGLQHPPLELLFTGDEETGLNGAKNLQTAWLTGKTLINIDTEEWGAVYVGCAGGLEYEVRGALEAQAPRFENFYRVAVGGLKGGHSGIDIHRGRGHAAKLLGQFLTRPTLDFDIAEIRAGRAHNIIPREAHALVGLAPEPLTELKASIAPFLDELKNFLPAEDHGLEISITPVEDSPTATVARHQALALLALLPHGAHAYDWNFEPALARHSNNLAQFRLTPEAFFAELSLRFNHRSEIQPTAQKIEQIARHFGLEAQALGEYPSWTPNFDSPLLAQIKNVYEREFAHQPQVKAIHAGLECGLLSEKLPGMDMISFGPTIENAHSPTERVEVAFGGALLAIVKSPLGGFLSRGLRFIALKDLLNPLAKNFLLVGNDVSSFLYCRLV